MLFSTKVLKAYLIDIEEVDRYLICFSTQKTCRAVINTKDQSAYPSVIRIELKTKLKRMF